MKRIIAVTLCFALAFVFPVSARADEAPETSAEAFVLYCVENGEIILSKNENKRMKPASTTKLMTTLLTLEAAAKNDRIITFTDEMTAEGSSMYLEKGEKVRLSDLAAGMMMCSGNDAANAAAISLSGSMEKFSELMNSRAKQIGMKNTCFVTPSGLDDENHYSSAYDLALLMAEALKNEAFSNLTFQKSVPVRFVEPSDKAVTYTNHNRLLKMYDDCIGGKTGYTSEAGRCLVSAARRGCVTLICVTLNDKDDWNDHIALYDNGFSRLSGYQSGDASACFEIPCAGGEKSTVAVMGESDALLIVASGEQEKIKRKIFIDSFAYAPVKKGDVFGKIEYSLDGRRLKTVELVAVEDIGARTVKKNLFQKIKEYFSYG